MLAGQMKSGGSFRPRCFFPLQKWGPPRSVFGIGWSTTSYHVLILPQGRDTWH